MATTVDPQKIEAAKRCLVTHPRSKAHAISLQGFLRIVLLSAWSEGDDFDGKRLVGSGSWRFDVYAGLIRAGLVDGKLDEDGCVDRLDQEAADELVQAVIENVMGQAPA